MTLEDLKVFIEVCEAQSLSEVARRLGCTQPAVSQHISRIERELQIRLFERDRHGVQLTEAGQVMMESARESLGALATGVGRVQEIQGRVQGRLTITTGGTSVRHFLTDTVVKFRRAHTDVTLRFQPANTTGRCLDLVRGAAADLALVTVHGNPRGIEQRAFIEQDLRLLVPKDDHLANRKRLRIRDLEGMSYIGLSEDTTSGGYLGDTFEVEGIEIQQSMTVDDFDTACVFVELGLGYAIVPAVQAANFCRSSRVCAIPVVDLPAISVGLAAKRWNTLSSVAVQFADTFAAELKRMSRLPGVSLLTQI